MAKPSTCAAAALVGSRARTALAPRLAARTHRRRRLVRELLDRGCSGWRTASSSTKIQTKLFLDRTKEDLVNACTL